MHGPSTKEMRWAWSALLTILVTAASAVHPQVEMLKGRILANLGMAGLPDMSAVNTSESEMQRMLRKFQVRVLRSEEGVITYHQKGCKKRNYVLFHPELSNDTDLTSARLRFPDSTTLDVSDWVQQWRLSGNHGALAVPCRERHCCRTRLELQVRQPRAKRSTCVAQCCRKSLKISFKDIGWDWVLQPKEFNAYYCRGRCRDVNADFANTHALMQSILNYKGRKVAQPCCVPKRLRPLDLLHYNDKDPPELVVTRHKGMIVKECACT